MPLKEYVSYKNQRDVETGLLAKYGESGAYGPGTFGVEFEFEPSGRNIDDAELGSEIIRHASSYFIWRVLPSDPAFEDAYREWVFEERSRVNRRFSIWGWDDAYGPPDADQWLEMNPKPEDEDAVYDWEIAYNSADREYTRWERRDLDDYYEKFIDEMGDKIWEYFSPVDVYHSLARAHPEQVRNIDYSERTADVDIRAAQEFIQHDLGQELNSKTSTATEWNVDMDGDNVEIRTKHLTRNEIVYVEKTLEWVNDNYKTTGDTSAHVHVGLPANFSTYDLLAISTLVDEKAVKSAVGPDRALDAWAALRDGFTTKVSKKIEEYLNEKKISAVKMSDDQLKKLVVPLMRKFVGTNISSTLERNTVEFRYFGSKVSPSVLTKWIQYFMLLPRVAQTRNRIKLGNIVLIRGENGEVGAALADKKSSLTSIPDDSHAEKYLQKLRDKKNRLT